MATAEEGTVELVLSKSSHNAAKSSMTRLIHGNCSHSQRKNKDDL